MSATLQRSPGGPQHSHALRVGKGDLRNSPCHAPDGSPLRPDCPILVPMDSLALCSAPPTGDAMPSPVPEIPKNGRPITLSAGRLNVPDQPILPFIEGDGTGPDIWRASQRVLDAAVAKAYGGKRKFGWTEVYAGEKAKNLF